MTTQGKTPIRFLKVERQCLCRRIENALYKPLSSGPDWVHDPNSGCLRKNKTLPVDRKAASDLWRHTLSHIRRRHWPTVFPRVLAQSEQLAIRASWTRRGSGAWRRRELLRRAIAPGSARDSSQIAQNQSVQLQDNQGTGAREQGLGYQPTITISGAVIANNKSCQNRVLKNR
jgi:hypothetical protein